MTDLDIAKKYMSLHTSATNRGLEFGLKLSTVKRLLTRKRCYFTNRPFEVSGDFGRSIDRLDNDKGYVEGNVVACTVDINRKKGNLTLSELKQIADKLL